MAKQRKQSGFHSVAHLIKKVTGHLVEHPNSKAHLLWRYWRRAVGDHIARHTEPIRLENGVLHVRVEHSVWMANLAFMKPQILMTLQKSYPQGKISDLRFREESLKSKPAAEAKKTVPSLPPAIKSEQQQAKLIVAKVQDPDLKVLLGRLYESHLVRKRTDPDFYKN
ncbi:MAG: DUF721 domain-containing protein [Magnetococcales bacterium]|nr:DUF721 domain-containing protein [Magnetococcales bacterium]